MYFNDVTLGKNAMLETRHFSPAAVNYEPPARTDNRMTNNIAEKFIAALTELESARDVEPLIALFADDCEVGNVVVSEKFRGKDGARRFWTRYRAAFKDICSIFQNEIYSGNQANLEWTTEGRSVNGRKIKYQGVSILKTVGGEITHFHAYFDRQVLRRQMCGNRQIIPIR